MRPTPAPNPATSGAPAPVWLAWAVAAAASIQLAPNPFYVTVVIATAVLVVQARRGDSRLAGAFPVLLAAGIVFGAVRLVLNALTTHGSGDVLFRLPAATLPAILGGFTVGGTVEVPVVARAAAEGWAIVGVIAAFGAFNAVVSHHELVRAAPRAFHELGLAVTVALAFVPSTIEAITEVREADRARTGGRIVRRGRLLRQIVPVLESGMEHAVLLAESMDSRGFARDRTSAHAAAGWLGLGALLLGGATFVALIGREATVAAATAAVAVVLLGAAVGVGSRAARRVTYRRRTLRPLDWALAAAASAAPLSLAVLAATGETTLRWPAAELSGAPRLAMLPLAAIAILAVPPLVAGARR